MDADTDHARRTLRSRIKLLARPAVPDPCLFRGLRDLVLGFVVAFLAGCLVLAARAQNIVEDAGGPIHRPATNLTAAAVEMLIGRTPKWVGPGPDAATQRIAGKLDRHVQEFLEGAPWKPFQHTLGISGYEVYFDHPDDMFHALSLSMSALPEATATRVRRFLAGQLSNAPPYSHEGFDQLTGRDRESYTVPESLRIRGLGRRTGAFGVYALWVYCTQTEDRHAVVSHWPAIKLRMLPLLGRDDPFDPQRTNYTDDEAETLNGNLAGLIGLARLARLNRDADLEARARVGVSNLLTLRVNLERVNSRILEPTKSSSKSLHIAKLARYGHLVPEVADAVCRWSDGVGPERLKAFREARNGWYLAFGDRLVGGENYTNPPHFVRTLFGGVVFVEQLPAADIIGFLDVPWCRGDFFFMEQCVLALWAAAGRPWAAAE